MKLYLTICSLCLLSGTVLGYLNGKFNAGIHFADACNAASIILVEDRQTKSKRHFHCFEIEPKAPVQRPVSPPSRLYHAETLLKEV